MKTELSVIIVNYNGLKYLKACFDSLAEKLAGIGHEIIVLDNDSQDESCDFIEKHYSKIRLIRSRVNLGFGRGNNEAVKHARGEHILLINNDTIVLDNLAPVLEFLKGDSSIGAVGIKMLDGNRNYLQSAGRFPFFMGMLEIKRLNNMGPEFRTGRFTRPFYEVDWLSGSFIMMRKEVYDETGGFDEDYFMYVEDVDLSKKIALKGYKRVFLPQYSYIHFVGFSKAKNPMLIKGYKIYISKYYKGFGKLKMLAALKVNEWVKIIKSKLNK